MKPLNILIYKFIYRFDDFFDGLVVRRVNTAAACVEVAASPEFSGYRGGIYAVLRADPDFVGVFSYLREGDGDFDGRYVDDPVDDALGILGRGARLFEIGI